MEVTYHGASPVAFERKPQVTRPLTGVKMLVNDRKEIRNVGMPPQFQPLWIQIKQSHVVETVFVSLNLSISGREEVGFSKYSEFGNTHNWFFCPREASWIVFVKNRNPSVNVKKDCTRLQARTTTLTERRKAHSSTGQATVVPCA